MRFIHNIEFIIRNLVDDEFKDKIDNLKRSYPDAFVEGGIGKRGGLSNNFGARYILNNNTEGLPHQYNRGMACFLRIICCQRVG